MEDRYINPIHMKKLIIWDEETDIFLNGFVNSNQYDIVLHQKKEQNDKNHKYKKISLNEIYQILKNENAGYDAVIILAELNWEDQPYLQGFYGITIAQELRKDYKCKLPILFVSSVLPINIKEIDKQKREIIGAVGHGFVVLQDFNIQSVEDNLTKIHPLNELQYKYVKKNHCDIRGTIGSRFHKIKNIVRAYTKAGKSKDEIIKLINNELIVLAELSSEFLKVSEVIKGLTIFEKKDDNQKKIEIDAFIERHDSVFFSYFSKEGEFETQSTSKKPWEILWLEDGVIDENILKKLKASESDDEKLIKIHPTKSFYDAKKIIEGDKCNKITVVIADFRLYDNSDKTVSVFGKNHKEQDKQGYDFLLWLTGQDRFNKMIALSGLGRTFLSEFFKKQNVNVKIYSKNDTAGSGANIFVDDVIEYGDEEYDVILRQPTSEKWKTAPNGGHSLHDFYKEHRNSCNYRQVEDKVNATAKKIISVVKRILQGTEEHLVVSQIPKLKGLSSIFYKTKKDPSNKNDFNLFKNKLIARRIGFWLFYCEGMSREQVTSVLQYQSLESRNVKFMQGQVLNEGLVLATEDFPFRILVEEKNWFTDYMGVDIYTLEDTLTQIGTHYEEWIKKLFTSEEIPKEIHKNYMKDGIIIVHTNMEGKQLLRIIYENIKNDIEKENEFLSKTEELLKQVAKDKYCEGYLDNIQQFIFKLTQEKVKREMNN